MLDEVNETNSFRNFNQNMNIKMFCNRIENMNNIEKNENDEDQLSLIFRYNNEYNNPKITILCSRNEKISKIIEKLEKKTGNSNSGKFFLYNGKNLKPNLTVYENGLINNSEIVVISMKNGIGGGISLYFTDVSKNRIKELKFSEDAPSYRRVDNGINIFGICNFKKCNAYKKEVVVMIKEKKFDLIKQKNNLYCPECEAPINPKTVGFYLCKFKIYGKKVENGKEIYFDSKIDEANDKNSVKYFDPEENGEVMITQLIFEVIEYLQKYD